MKKYFGLLFGLGICALLGVWREGLVFLCAALFVSLPEPPAGRWYGVVLGGLLAAVGTLAAGDSVPVFWALTATALTALSLRSLPRTVILAGLSWLMLRNGAGPEIYVPFFVGVIYNAALAFAFEEIGVENEELGMRN